MDMAIEADPLSTFQESRPQYSEWRRIVRIFFGRKLAVIGLVIIVLLMITAIFAPLLAPYDPYQTNPPNKLSQPSRAHWLGTDSLGRDTLSRVIYASRTSLLVAVGAMGMAAVIGQTLGLIAGYFGGWWFHIIMRIMDGLMSIPMLINALVIAAVLGGGLRNVIIALGIGMAAGQCRMMCAQALTVKQNDYILAVRTIGVSHLPMMLRHIYPNAFQPLLVMITIGLGMTILAEAGLSFLGMGISPPEAAWGSMINDGYKYLFTNPVLSIAPGVAIMLVVFGFNMVGDGLRDALDPRLRGTL
jgi:ABC-type dipeptide/oligopeptide/nickel transport system permease subunit